MEGKYTNTQCKRGHSVLPEWEESERAPVEICLDSASCKGLRQGQAWTKTKIPYKKYLYLLEFILCVGGTVHPCSEPPPSSSPLSLGGTLSIHVLTPLLHHCPCGALSIHVLTPPSPSLSLWGALSIHIWILYSL